MLSRDISKQASTAVESVFGRFKSPLNVDNTPSLMSVSLETYLVILKRKFQWNVFFFASSASPVIARFENFYSNCESSVIYEISRIISGADISIVA